MTHESSPLFQKKPFRTQLRERPNAEVHLQATWNEEEQPLLLSSLATTLGKSSQLQMHKAGKTVHSSANCPLFQGAHKGREEEHQHSKQPQGGLTWGPRKPCPFC